MRLPVSRARYDLLEHNMRALVAQLRADLAAADARATAAEARVENLTERLLSLRMAGATPEPPTSPAPTPAAPVQSDELKDAIREKCGNNLAQRALMLRQLAADRADGIKDEEILRRIQTGNSSDNSEGLPV